MVFTNKLLFAILSVIVFFAGIAQAEDVDYFYAVSDSSGFVKVQGENFYLNGQKWFPFGVNYWPSYFSHELEPVGSYSVFQSPYYEDHIGEIEKELSKIEQLGFNAVWVPSGGNNSNFVNFLSRLKKHNLKAGISLSCNPFSQNHRADCVSRIQELNSIGVTNDDTIFAYDLAWEVHAGSDSYTRVGLRTNLNDDWTNWVKDKYGSISRAESTWGFTARKTCGTGLICGPTDTELCNDGTSNKMVLAYRRFIEDYANKEFGAMVSEIRKYDANHLITARMGYGGNGQKGACFSMPLDIRTSTKYFDFVSYESWVYKTEAEIKRSGFISSYGNTGKPTVDIEFGGCACYPGSQCVNCMDSETPEAQKVYYSRVYEMLKSSGTKGSFSWWFVGVRPMEKSDYGVVQDNANLDDKPVCSVIRSYTSIMKNLPDRVPNQWIVVDRDLHAGDWQMYQTGMDQYISALNSGKVPAVVTACSGKTSKDKLTVDGVLPKCLNSLFDVVQVKNASGSWVDVSDDSVVYVAKNKPIYARASVSNLGEAKWLSPQSTGGGNGTARLGGNENHGLGFRTSISRDVPWLGSYDFGEFKVSDGIATDQNLRFQMVSEWVAWFGEAVDIKIVPVEPKPNGQKCASSSECSSGNCINTYCCNAGQCGGVASPMCFSNGQTASNQWFSGICKSGQWRTVLNGIGCNIFPCDSGTCVSNYCRLSGTKLANGQKCASSSECSSGNCINTYCCNAGQCGGVASPMCFSNGQTASNQWFSGICKSGQWRTVLNGIGCNIFPCDQGTCVNNYCRSSGTVYAKSIPCEPNQISGCSVCNQDGTAWADDNSRCAAGQVCTSGQCANQALFNLTCPSSCTVDLSCACEVSSCSEGLVILRNIQGKPINITRMVRSGDFPVTFFDRSHYERAFEASSSGTVSALALCLEAGKFQAQTKHIQVEEMEL